MPGDFADEAVDRLEERFGRLGRERVADRVLRAVGRSRPGGGASDVDQVAVAEDVRRDVVVRSAYDAADRVLVALETATERRLELFDLRADPLEEHPQTVESGGGGVGAALAARLAETKATHVPCAPGPVVFPTADAELVERLRALGYLTE